MTGAAEVQLKKSRRFDWGCVDPDLLRAMLVEFHKGKAAALERIDREPDDQLIRFAEKAFGARCGQTGFDKVAKIVQTVWIPKASAKETEALAALVAISTRGRIDPSLVRTKAARREFLLARNLTTNFKKNLRKAFIQAHKREFLVQPGGSAWPAASTFGGKLSVAGAGEVDPRTPFDHQRNAWERLGELEQSPEGSGLLILPTGGGKTFTAVTWLRQMVSEKGYRVLWVADQQELVDQAWREFARQAAFFSKDSVLHGRVIHGRASPSTTLAEPDLDVACITRQSLMGQGFDSAAKRRLTEFLKRPTVVVIDEAHHAVAAEYQKLITWLKRHQQRTLLLGLTATPWPSGYGRTKLLRETFRFEVASVMLRDLVSEAILATPLLHVVETGVTVSLTDEEKRLALAGDLPADLLRRLDTQARNGVVVRAWLDRADTWGKTLVFACDIQHADSLVQSFKENGVTCFVVHSQSPEHQSSVIERFRRHVDPAVFISVGMLLEGVDIPSARTAFLVRPTLSRVLMRQMIGRVLRGPEAGGESEAHIVDLRDRWTENLDVLSPVDLPNISVVRTQSDNPDDPTLPAIYDEVTGEPIPEHVIEQIAREYLEISTRAYGEGVVHSANLLGYYDLDLKHVPLFEHAQDRWRELFDQLARGERAKAQARKLFDDLHSPRPTAADIDAVVAFWDSTQSEPPIQPLQVRFSLDTIVTDILNAAPRNAADQLVWLHQQYESSLARASFTTFQRFHDAVHQRLLSRSGLVGGLTPEMIPSASESTDRARLGRARPSRDLTASLRHVTREARSLIVGHAQEDDLRQRLDVAAPACEWTRRPIKTAWAYWQPRGSGRNAGTPVIRVNLALNAPIAQVSDELLQYLLWHELCHQLLPGQGHDADFRELEARWPDAAALDYELDRLTEAYAFGEATGSKG